MRTSSHSIMGGSGAIAVLCQLSSLLEFGVASALIGGAIGASAGKAPDRMEYLAFGLRWVKHRTLTHWPVLWLAITAFGIYMMVFIKDLAVPVISFGVGGLCHLLGDWMTPKGIPTIFPTKRFFHSSKLVKSGFSEFIAVLLFCSIMACLCLSTFSPYFS